MSANKHRHAARLRLLADWFDLYDDHDAAGRARLLIDPRSPGHHGVSADLRAIAASLPWESSQSAPGADELKIIAAWFEAHPQIVGRLFDERLEAGRIVQRDLRAIAVRLEATGKPN